MAFRRYMSTTNIDYPDIVVVMGTLSNTSSELDEGTHDLTTSNGIKSRDGTLSSEPSQQID